MAVSHQLLVIYLLATRRCQADWGSVQVDPNPPRGVLALAYAPLISDLIFLQSPVCWPSATTQKIFAKLRSERIIAKTKKESSSV